MKKWTNFFDAIYLINLPTCNERLRLSLNQLHYYDIPVEVFEATFHEQGVIGLRDTMIRLFYECLERGYQNVLVFEDDLLVVEDLNKYMPLCLEQLPSDFRLFYLGGHIITPFKERYSENILSLTGVLATHAIGYSRKVIEILLEAFNSHSTNPRDKTTIDMIIFNKIIITGGCYISYPLLISQQAGFSIIEKKDMDYKSYIEDKYKQYVAKLI